MSIGGAILSSLAISLILTLVLESGFYLLTVKLFKNRCNLKDFFLVLLVNLLTNPAVVLSYWLVVLYTGFNIIFVLFLLEAVAVLTEGYCFKKYGISFLRPYIYSLCVNTFSVSAGFLIQLIFN
ncbi:MAG: hypothetical protein FWG70_03490 [Oscillospiraceae bacterium]|nr:hypothetical protein [Oscillospiraceae bacterium]